MQTEKEFNLLNWEKADCYALVCGWKVGDKYLCAIDIDKVDFDLKNFPATFMEKTPRGGTHLLYLCEVLPERNEKVDYLELKGKGSLICMYDTPMDNNQIQTVYNLNVVFDDVVKKLGLLKKKNGQEKILLGLEESLKVGVEKGDRHLLALSFAHRLRRERFSEDDAFDKLLLWDQHNTPPLETDQKGDIQKCVLDAYHFVFPSLEVPKKIIIEIDPSSFPELTVDELTKVLNTTIKEDKTSKLILFLADILTYSDLRQLVVMLLEGTCTGKTYLMNEVAWYLPKEDVNKLDGATPKSFLYRSSGKYVDYRTREPIDWSLKPEKGDSAATWEHWNSEVKPFIAGYLDYSKKIFIFPDMPDAKLLATLQPLLSHDCQFALYQATKSDTLTTKFTVIKGYFTVNYASTNTEIDDQIRSRSLSLSPEDSKTKQEEALTLTSRINSEPNYFKWYETDPLRVGLKNRVQAIKDSGYESIFVPPELIKDVEEYYKSKINFGNPKVQRDYRYFIGLIAAWAFLNLMHRDKKDGVIYANRTDFEAIKKIYEPVMICNELGLSPAEYEVWKIIQPHTEFGLTVREVHQLYQKEKKRRCSDERLRGMLKNFCSSGLLLEQKEGKHGKLRYFGIEEKTDEKKSEQKDEEKSEQQKIDSPKPTDTLETIVTKPKQNDPTEILLKLMSGLEPKSIDEMLQSFPELRELPREKLYEFLERLVSEGKLQKTPDDKYVIVR